MPMIKRSFIKVGEPRFRCPKCDNVKFGLEKPSKRKLWKEQKKVISKGYKEWMKGSKK